jgi:hypothetical protein
MIDQAVDGQCIGCRGNVLSAGESIIILRADGGQFCAIKFRRLDFPGVEGCRGRKGLATCGQQDKHKYEIGDEIKFLTARLN